MNKIDELIEKLCPNGVEYRNFNDIASYIRGITYNKYDEVKKGNNGYKLLRANNITLESNSINFDDVKIIDFSVKVKDSQLLKKHDILICAGSGSKAHIGKVAYIFEDMNYTFGGFMGVIRVNKNLITPRYLFHIMTSPIFKNHLEKVLKTSTINNINNDTWINFKIPVPPLEIQNEIVSILDKFTDALFKLKELLKAELKARKKQYAYYASKLFLEIDADLIEIAEIANFVYGYTDTAKDVGDTRFIRITDINDQGYLKSQDQKFITLSDKSKNCLLKKGDIVMARTGATYGKTLYFDSDYPSVYASFLIKIIFNNRMLSKYYWHFTKTPLYWEQANKLVTTGTQPQFNAVALKKIKIPVPPIEEQERIISILDRFDKFYNDIYNSIPAEIEARQKQYEYYRDKLLTFKELVIDE